MNLSTSRFRSRARAVAAGLAGAMLLAGCGAGGESSVSRVPLSDGVAAVGFEPPTLLLSPRAIIETNLELVILVDGEPVAVARDSAGVFVASLERSAGQPFMLSLIWYERIEGRDDLPGDLLPLARFAPTEPYVPVAGEPLEIRIFAQQYDTNFDFDDDGRTNLAEQRADSSPFVPDAAPPVVLPFGISVELPSALAEADDELRASFGVRAIVNTQVLQLSREDDEWRGQTSVNEGSSPFVSFEFFSDSDPSLVLASLQSRVELESSTPSATFGEDDELYRYPNGDGDSLTNIEELIAGEERNPRRSDDPAADPCETSAFTAGCTIDTDGDGRFDSQEGENADRDSDGIPDFRESSAVDGDGDGRFADADPDDGNACIPSADNDPCRDSLPPVDPCADSVFTSGCLNDTDNDGRSDFQETETADRDNDGIPDFRESSLIDADGDLRFADADIDENDPCVPSSDNDACRATLPPPDPCDTSRFATGCRSDADGDGLFDWEEGENTDTDGDGFLDYLESNIDDADGDQRTAHDDVDDNDPCVPSANNAPCLALQPPPPPPPVDPCVPSTFVFGCTTDTDGDGRSNFNEGEGPDSDEDGVPDFRESSAVDANGNDVAADADPCEPSIDNDACRALTVTTGATTGSGVADAGATDAGATDAGAADAGATDAGATDAGAADAGAADAGATDAGATDAGATDAGAADAGVADAGTADAGGVDAGVADGGAIDPGLFDPSGMGGTDTF